MCSGPWGHEESDTTKRLNDDDVPIFFYLRDEGGGWAEIRACKSTWKLTVNVGFRFPSYCEKNLQVKTKSKIKMEIKEQIKKTS